MNDPIVNLIETEKFCLACQTWKPRSEFYRNKATGDGLESSCKACKKAYSKQWRKDNKEQANKTMRAWRKKNPTKNAEYCARWRKDNPEAIKQARQNWVDKQKKGVKNVTRVETDPNSHPA